MSSDSSTPVCLCGNMSKENIVQKPGKNQGKKFYACATRSCDFFKWGDGSQSLRSSVVVPPLQPAPPSFMSARGPTFPPNPPFTPPTRVTEGSDVLLVKATAAILTMVDTLGTFLNRFEGILDSMEPPRKRLRTSHEEEEEDEQGPAPRPM
jgi:hypothetical protein